MTADQLILQYKKYGLRPFKEIIHELLQVYPQPTALQNVSVLELGPGTKVNLLRFLAEKNPAATVRGAGRHVVWPWTPQRAFIEQHVANTFLLPHLNDLPARSIDIIYSRHVMEQHSIHAGILITSPVYRRYIRDNRFQKPGIDLPASVPNLQAVFRNAYKALKKNGVIISQIAKSKYGVLDDSFLKKLKAKQVNRRSIGRLSEIVTVIK